MYATVPNPPLFLMGTTDDDKQIKLRIHPKKDLVGIDPRAEEYGYVGSEWLMGYIIAKDGVADLYVSIPLDALWKGDAQELLHCRQKTPLDMVIAVARSKNKID